MIKPTISELTKGEMNRYELVIAIAKCARMVTDEYVVQRERADRMVANRETNQPASSFIAKEYRDEKAVKTAIKRFHGGRYQVTACAPDCEAADEE